MVQSTNDRRLIMRKWKCKRIKALLEGEPLIVFTEYEDDNENGFIVLLLIEVLRKAI